MYHVKERYKCNIRRHVQTAAILPGICYTLNSVGRFCRHQKSIVATLKDADISIRRRGLDLLFTMCNNQNVRDIVDELLKYLEIADFSMRDELVLKTAVLAERSVQPCVSQSKHYPLHLVVFLLKQDCL